MHRSASFLLFLLPALAIYGGAHYYLWARLIRASALPAPWHVVLSVLLVGLALTVPAVFLIARLFGWSGSDVFMWPGFVWTGLLLFLLLTLLSVDVARLLGLGVTRLVAPELLSDPGRRLFLARIVAGGATVIAAGLSGYAIHSAVAGPGLRRLKVALARLPQALHGFKIVQLSDLHVGRTIGRAYVEEVVRQVQEQEPDLIAITGDLFDGSPAQLAEAVAPIAELTAPHGVFFVTGNHDHYSGVEPWLAWLRRRGVRVLRNERVQIGTEAASFDLAGVDDSYFSADVARALEGQDPRRELVLLAHQPQEVKNAVEHRVGLQLSGHTHGGQIFPFTLFAKRLFHWVAGLYQIGETQLYVSRGTGYVGPPMRLGAPSEITCIELQAVAGPS